MQLLYIAIAGALGSLTRYGLSGLAQKVSSEFPIGTLTVNVLGSLIIGFIMQISLDTDIIPRSMRVVITIGFLGAFTTFSTFSYETARFFEDGAWVAAVINIVSNLGICLLATIAGMTLGRLITGGA